MLFRSETVNSDYIAQLCSKDWGLWRTVTGNLEKVKTLLQGYGALGAADKEDVLGKAETILETLDSIPKSLSWRMRARVGESRKWYNEVEDLYR